MSTYTGPNTTVPQFFDIVEKHSADFTAIQAELAAADGDVEKARAAWLDSTDNAEVQKLRAAIEAAQSKLTALAEKNVEVKTLSEEDKAAKTEKLKSLRDEIRHGRALILDIAGTVPGGDLEGVKAALDALPDPTRGKRVGTSGGAKTGSTLPRVSVDLTVSGGKFQSAPFKSFSALATATKTEVEDLQKAFAAAAGVEHQEISSVKRLVEFKFQAADGEPVLSITATPKKLDAKTA